MSEFKVLLPLDGSRIAEHSLVYLSALRCLGSLKVRLVSVVDDSEESPKMPGAEADEREANLLLPYLHELSRDLEEHLGIKNIEAKVLCGSPATCLLEETKSFDPDLLIISTHGRTGTRRWRFGGVADKVIRGADCNTLVIGPNATEHELWIDTQIEPAFTSILLPIDGSDLAAQAIGVAKRFAQSFNSTVHAVQVVGIPVQADGMAAGAYVPDVLGILVESAEANLQLVKAQLEDVEVKTDVQIGYAAGALEDYVRNNGIGLVVMTSHGRGGFVRTALGSVTDRMLSVGKAPVLVVRPKVDA